MATSEDTQPVDTQPAISLKPRTGGGPHTSSVGRVNSETSSDLATRTLVFRSNLPAQSTSFIGREHALLSVVHLILSPQIRLLTLVGPGGIGKTRLAIESGSAVERDFRDGVFFVPLAPVREAEAVTLAIAQAVGIEPSGERLVLETLKEALLEKEALLVLDNTEQVVAAILVVNEVLTSCPKVKLLVTSRMALNVRGEHLFEVPALSLPLRDHGSRIEEIEKCDAVRLFTERASAIKAGFAVTEENASDIAEICRRLDGIPLAIELVAARIRLFTPQAMLPRLTSRLKLLGGGLDDLPERQRTMRNAIGWSYELLGLAEQRLFQRLSICPGGCTLETAEAVCDSDLGIEVVDGIDSLLRQSLLRSDEKAGEMRFSMLETIREYGLEMLGACGEEATISLRCVEQFLKLAEESESELTGPRQAHWLGRLEREHDNLRFALRWSSENGREDYALRIAGAIWRFWANRGYLTEGRRWLDIALRGAAETDSLARARALRGAGNLAWRQADFAVAREYHEASLTISRATGDRTGIAAALNNLAGVAMYEGDRPRARSLYEEALDIYRSLNNEINVAVILVNLGAVAEATGDLPAARKQIEEGLDISRRLKDKSRMALALYNLSVVSAREGRIDVAHAYAEESLAVSRELGDRFRIAPALGQLGEMLLKQGLLEQARGCLRESLSLENELGDRRRTAQALTRLAAHAIATGRPDRAARISGAADALREDARAAISFLERESQGAVVAAATQKLGKSGFSTAWSEGYRMTLETAVGYALEVEPAGDETAHQMPGYLASNPLSDREREVVILVAQGLSNAEIAERLVISPRTAETHVNHVLNKLGFSSRVQIAAWAVQKRLCTAGD